MARSATALGRWPAGDTAVRSTRWRGLLRNWSVSVGGGLVVVLAVVGLLTPVLTVRSPTALHPGEELRPPTVDFPFGTDELGRDVASRVLNGARTSLFAAVSSVSLAAATGVPLGVAIGLAGGLVDLLAMRAFDILFAFPAILLAIAIVAALGPSLRNLVLTITLLTMPQFAVMARGVTLAARPMDYVQAAVALGASMRRIAFTHVLPNVVPPLIVTATLNLSIVILVEAGLSFLGLGTQPPAPTLGGMISRGRQYMTIAPWLVVFPGLAIMVAVLGFNLLGDGLREVLDPKLRQGGGR
ncbi:MAG: ABC transporter permease [Armatimonadota bacterium]|nr:ABC transporter permease [Armatimonadota bacterium]